MRLAFAVLAGSVSFIASNSSRQHAVGKEGRYAQEDENLLEIETDGRRNTHTSLNCKLQ